MYRTGLSTRDRSGAIAAVAGVHALLLAMLLHLSGRMDLAEPQSVLRLFDVREVPPPPEQAAQPRPELKPKPKRDIGAASPKNVKSRATEVKAPRPEVAMPVPVPVETSKTPNQGTQATQGAADQQGPGSGAGGSGTGTGSGASGSGSGAGGEGGYISPPQLLTPVLRGRDFPRQLLDDWPPGAQLFLRLRITPAGQVGQCIVDRGTGIPALDSTVCAIVQQRFRFAPSRNLSGQPVAGWFGYRQVPPQ